MMSKANRSHISDMLSRPCSRPYFRPGNVHVASQPTELIGRRPTILSEKLAVNGLMPDEATDRRGNFGIDAFARSLAAQMQGGLANDGPSASVRNRRTLRQTSDKVGLLRRVGVAWLEANASETLWTGMSVSKLCCTVSGWSFQEYLTNMRKDNEWVDTAFLHALGRAYGVNVLIIQSHIDETIVGEDLTETDNKDGALIAVPVALVNDRHFWGVLPCEDNDEVCPVDKGDYESLRSQVSKGLCSSSHGHTSPTVDHSDELDDGEVPDLAHAPTTTVSIEAELEMCTALSSWVPWDTPSAALIQAMERVQRVREAQPGTLDIVTTCQRRAEAITALAYEDAHFAKIPPALRYQRLARIRIQGVRPWRRRRGHKDNQLIGYLSTSSGIQSLESLSKSLHEGACERHNKAHGPNNLHCKGVGFLTATMVYNWRVLWWSLPQVQRKEHLLRFFVDSLRDHRATGLPDERWRVQYKFLGINMCRDAFLTLSGLGSSSLQSAREQALTNKVSWSSPAERGMHGGTMANNSKAAKYLGARQWLEHYAATHAEMSPMDAKAYLPAGRKCFYYAHYRKDMLERYGVTEADAQGARAYALASSRRSKRPRTDGRQNGDLSTAENYASYQRMADVPLAEIETFMSAWRVECAWLVVCKSVSMFTRCSVCEYLRLLIDQTPRDQTALRGALQARLGDHYEFQAAQRLAHNRLEEECAQSGGTKWLMLIDKMDQLKTICPSIWSQLATRMFKEHDKRLVTGLIGSMWFGTRAVKHHVRTLFNDCEHGAEMQCSAIVLNLHDVAMCEGHLPEALTIGADNTPKETKKQYAFWFFVWLLCALNDTPLRVINVVFLMVGHTHNKLDRLFSRISVALRGRDHFTVEGLLRQVRETLTYTELHSGHVCQVWDWKGLAEGDMPGRKYRMKSLYSAHAFKFSWDHGVSMQWKQWCTNEEWSMPVQLLSASEAQEMKSWRPSPRHMKFNNAGQDIMVWLGRLETWCAAQPDGSVYLGLHREFTWLRDAINHCLPGAYAPGKQMDDILRDLRQLPHTRPDATAPSSQRHEFPHDMIAQWYPGADVPKIANESLVRIEGLTHHYNGGPAIRSTVVVPGSNVLIAAPEGTTAHGQSLQILVGQVVDTSCKRGTLVVAWYLPDLARVENFRGGRKKQVIDVFGPWTPMDDLGATVLNNCRLPDPIVPIQSILEANFDLTEDHTLPYDVIDTLRSRHSIDLSGFNTSMTRYGNLYRSYALMRGA